jgi:hypothetical protein
MVQIFFGIYLVLGLPAFLLLWKALAASRTHNKERYDRQGVYQTTSTISNFENA